MRDSRVYIYNLGLNNRDRVARACASMFGKGKLGVMPTDTIYGFSGDYFDESLRSLIMGLKNRDSSKGFIVLLPDVVSLESFAAQEIPSVIKDLLPAPLTLVVKNRYSSLYGEETIAVRVPDNVFIRDIFSYMEKSSVLVSTSFNYKGNSILDVVERDFSDKLDFFVFEGEPLKDSKASTILDISSKPYKVLREGDYELSPSLFV